MNFLKSFAQIFANAAATGGQGGIMGMLMKMKYKFIAWTIVTVTVFIMFWIAMLFQCSKPEGSGVCIHKFEKGLDNTFTYDLSNIEAGGECTDDEIYTNAGQKIDWIDTGFVTDGNPLIIYVSGNYFPWGEEQTTKSFGYHISSVQNSDGSFSETLDIINDYQECDLNTNLVYLNSDNQETRLAYENQLNNYTKWNSNNRIKSKSKILIDKDLQESKGLFLDNPIVQADCNVQGNCELGTTTEEQVGCVLKNGAGIYMRIGSNAEFSYHLINKTIPKLTKECLSDNECKYKYSKTGTSIDMVQIPFGLPLIVYDKDSVNRSSYIKDIRDKVVTSLIPITKSSMDTDYEFTAFEQMPDTSYCDNGLGYQILNGECYKSVTKKMSIEERSNPICPDTKTEILMPNELCAPQGDKKIYIKPANTCYDDVTGKITLLFQSGAKNMVPKASFENNGVKVSFVKKFMSQILNPFWGEQSSTAIEDITTVTVLSDSIRICNNNNENLYYSIKDNNYVIKTSKYEESGIILKDTNGYDTANVLNVGYEYDGKIRSCVIATVKQDARTTISNITHEYYNNLTTLLVNISNMKDGLFVQIRNAIMKSSVYYTARILFVVWFVFSFGFGFINKEKILYIKTIEMDWKNFLIIMWISDPNNYDMIDDLLWPMLFYGSQTVATAILNAVSGVWGTSLTYESPLDFFDDITSELISKEMIYKLGAVATTPSAFYMFFLLFPLFIPQCVKLFFIILSPVISLCFTMFGIGQIIMFMPIYAILSMFDSESDLFMATIRKLINEFMHFAFSLGFFGLLIGFIYHYFMQAMDVEICWKKKISINFLYIFQISLYDWQFDGSATQKIKTVWNMISAVFQLMLITGVLGKVITLISETLANIFVQGSGSFGLTAAQQFTQTVQQGWQDTVDSVSEALKDEEEKATAKKGRKNELQDSGDDDIDNDKRMDKKIQRSGVKENEEKISRNNNNTQSDATIDSNGDSKNSEENIKTDNQIKNQNTNDDNGKNNSKNDKNSTDQRPIFDTHLGDKKVIDPKSGINNNYSSNLANQTAKDNLATNNTNTNNSWNSRNKRDIINDNRNNTTSSDDKTDKNNINNNDIMSENINRSGAGLQENDMGIKTDNVGLESNDAGIKTGNVGLEDNLIRNDDADAEVAEQKKLEDDMRQAEKNMFKDRAKANKISEFAKQEDLKKNKLEQELNTATEEEKKRIERDIKQKEEEKKMYEMLQKQNEMKLKEDTSKYQNSYFQNKKKK